MKKTYRAVSARHARALGLKQGATYEAEDSPAQRALCEGGHATAVETQGAEASKSKQKEG